MRILIVAATDRRGDRAGATSSVRVASAAPPSRRGTPAPAASCTCSLTGVGMVATAAWCSRALAETPLRSGVNVGLCGSFDRIARPGDRRARRLGSPCRARRRGRRTVSARSTSSASRTLSIAALQRAELRNPAPPAIAALDRLPKVRGITVNTVHGNERSIAAVVQRLESAGREHGRRRVHVRLPDARGAVRADPRGVERGRAAEPRGVEGARSDRRAGDRGARTS